MMAGLYNRFMKGITLITLFSLLLMLGCEQQPQAMREIAGDEYAIHTSSNDKVGIVDEGLSDKERKIKAQFCNSFHNPEYLSQCIDILVAPIPNESRLNFCESFKTESLRIECAYIVKTHYFKQETLSRCRVIKDEHERLACIGGLEEEEDRVEEDLKDEILEDENEVVIIDEDITEVHESDLPAPVDGYFSEWSSWSNCSKSCGGGSQQRHRSCFPAQHGGKDCEGESKEVRACNTQACYVPPTPVDGYFTQWSEWGICSKKCGSGYQKRYRKCIAPKNGGQPCLGKSRDKRKCNTHQCPEVPTSPVVDPIVEDKPVEVVETPVETPQPIDGYFTTWSDWSSCSKTCGGGKQIRKRTCIPPKNGGLFCLGDFQQERSCNDQACVVSSPPQQIAPMQCTSIDRKAIKLSFITEANGNVILSNKDYNIIKSVAKRNCSYQVSASLGFFDIFVTGGSFRINKIYGDAQNGVSAGEFKVHSINQTATQLGLIYFENDFYPSPYAKKNFSARTQAGAIYYKILSPGSSQKERVVRSTYKFRVDISCEARECVEDNQVTTVVNNQCHDTVSNSVKNKFLNMSNAELFQAALNREVGDCRIQDARNSTRTFCDYYVKTNVKGSLGMLGWPKNPHSGDSTGCIKAPQLPKRMSTCWPGNTASMCTNDHIQNAAETIRDAIKNCACF